MKRKISLIIVALMAGVYCLPDSHNETYYFYAKDKEISFEIPEGFHIYDLWSSHDFPGSNYVFALKRKCEKDNYFVAQWGVKSMYNYEPQSRSLYKDSVPVSFESVSLDTSDLFEIFLFNPSDSTYFLEYYIPELNFDFHTLGTTKDKLSETKQIINSIKIHPLKYTSELNLYDIIDSTGRSTKESHKNTGAFADPGIRVVKPPRE